MSGYRGVLELLFGNKNKDKRRHLRREKAFSADWTSAPEVPPTAVIGIDVSASGVGILSRDEIPFDEFIMRIKLDQRVIPVRVKKARSLPGTLQGQKAFRYGLEFVSISADDWDAVVRWSKGGAAAEIGNKAQADLEMVRMSADDAERLMPVALQNRLLSGLARRGRLAPLQPNQQPLVQYFYGGTVRRNGMLMPSACDRFARHQQRRRRPARISHDVLLRRKRPAHRDGRLAPAVRDGDQLVRVLAEGRRGTLRRDARAVDVQRRVQRGDRAFGRMVRCKPRTQRRDLRIVERFRDAVDGGVRHVGRFEPADPLGTWAASRSVRRAGRAARDSSPTGPCGR